jgi:hypothetical protein
MEFPSMTDIIKSAENAVAGAFSNVNVKALIDAGASLVAAWPTIAPEITALPAELAPLITAIEEALSGKTPSDADFAAVDEQLDTGDAEIEAAGEAAQAELDRRAADPSLNNV